MKILFSQRLEPGLTLLIPQAWQFTRGKFIQLQMYPDGRVVGRDSIPYMDQLLEPGHGTHRITVKGWDDLGAFSSSVTVTVS